MRETTAAPGAAVASPAEVALLLVDDDSVHPRYDSDRRGLSHRGLPELTEKIQDRARACARVLRAAGK